MYQAAVAAKTAFVLRAAAPLPITGLPRPCIQG
jgi:hypothetical protein